MSDERIDLILAARDKHYEETGEYLSYGKFCSKYPEKLPKKTDFRCFERKQKKPNHYNKLAEYTDEIVSLYLAGEPVSKIAFRYNVSPAAIRNRLRGEDVYKESIWTSENIALLKKLDAEGIAKKDIAACIGCSVNAVRSALFRYGE